MTEFKLKALTVPEKTIENSILRYLWHKKIFAFKIQSIGVFDPKTKVYRKSNNPFHINGISDVVGILPDGRFLAIEVKTPETLKPIVKNYESLRNYAGPDKSKTRHQGQIEFIEKIGTNRGVAFFAASVEEVQARLIAEGVISA